MRHYRWREQSRGRACTGRRVVHGPGSGWNRHDHDYPELFWVERGRLRHEWNGGEAELVAGDCCCLRPGEAHAAVNPGPGATAIINVSFAPAAERALRRRYRDDGLVWPWDDPDPVRRHLVLDERARRHLSALVDLVDPTLPSGRDLLLLGVAHCLQRGRVAGIDRLPAWLRHAAQRELAEGEGRFSLTALARRCGCSREHLTRLARRHAGRPLGELLTAWRLELAADDLRDEAQTVAAVAARYRFGSLSWFYEAFGDRFGAPPDAWRRGS